MSHCNDHSSLCGSSASISAIALSKLPTFRSTVEGMQNRVASRSFASSRGVQYPWPRTTTTTKEWQQGWPNLHLRASLQKIGHMHMLAVLNKTMVMTVEYMHACPMLGCWTTCQLWCFKNGWFQSLHLQQSFGRWIDSNSTIDPRFDTLARVSAVVCFFVYVATAWNPIHLSFTQKFDAPFGKLHQSMVQTERLKMIRQ